MNERKDERRESKRKLTGWQMKRCKEPIEGDWSKKRNRGRKNDERTGR